jgi:hypothetical protein
MLKRIQQLENRARARAAARAPVDVDDADEARKLEEFRSDLAILFYNMWRHDALPLEQRLDLARDDARFAPHDRHVRRAAREFEIRVLLRDGNIDDAAAWALRANADQHFGFGLGNERPPLAALPFTVEFDETEALREARLQCPRVERLPLERQLEMLDEDRARELHEREQRGERGLADPSMDAFGDRMHEVRVRDLRQKIRDSVARTASGMTTIEA